MKRIASLLAGAAVAATAAVEAKAQQLAPGPPPGAAGDTVRVAPGARYEAGPLRRFFDGDNWREAWTRPVRIPVLSLDTFAGGLEPVEQGGNQSRTLHLRTPDGRELIFRSTDKYPVQILPEDLVGTALQDLLQDHVSIFHPWAGLVVPPLNEALGLLAVPGVVRVMPDDPRLGRFRDTFAGMVGLLVERPNEGDDGEPGWRGYERIIGTDRLLERLEEDPSQRVDAREFLASRLLDFVVNDTDRGVDQWRWAMARESGGIRWRPIARDRDWALMDADGLLARGVRMAFFPKLAVWREEFPSIEGLTWQDRELSRLLLAGLDRAAWDSVTAEVREALTDAVLDDALARLPSAAPPGEVALLRRVLHTRRDQLGAMSREFYAELSRQVDVHASDLADRAELVRRSDGALDVSLYQDGDRYYHRTFVERETEEVRLDLHGGDDVAVVRGGGGGGIGIRVVGGGGDDTLYDRAAGGHTVFYVAEGRDTVVPGRDTRVASRPYRPKNRGTGLWFATETGNDRPRDWGETFSWLSPTAEYMEGAGVVVGGGPTWTRYGFRHDPFDRRLTVRLLVSPSTGRLGLRAAAVHYVESRPLSVGVTARATDLEATRFYGYGNDSPRPAVDDEALVRQRRVEAAITVAYETPTLTVGVGPTGRYTRPEAQTGTPAAGLPGAEGGGITEVGLQASARLRRTDPAVVPTRGFAAELTTEGFPATGGRFAAHALATAEARAYLPLPHGPVLALRAGGRRAWGDYPMHASAWIGGRTTVRGYRWQRFAGDAAAHGSAELRVPLFRANLWVARGRLGVLALADAGRVYAAGETPGGWHVGRGAGLYFETLGTALNLVWARGEEDRLYAGLGMPF